MSLTVEFEASTPMPYEARDSLLAMMYRIASREPAARTLLLVPRYWGELPLVGWDGDVEVRRYPFAPGDEPASGRFERVALHWLLEDVGRGASRSRAKSQRLELLRAVRRLLVPGGIVTGVVSNLLCLGERAGRPVLGLSAGSCRRLLEAGGFDCREVSIVLPSGDTPRIFISLAPRAARHHFRRQLAFNNPEQPFVTRVVRRVLVEAGISRYLQGSLVFSGRVK